MGDEDSVRLLLSARACVGNTDKYGRTAWWYAASGDQADIVEQLAKVNANVNITDCKGRNALFMAADNGRAASIKALCNCGVDFYHVPENLTGINEHFAWTAGVGNRIEILRILHEGGMDLGKPLGDQGLAT